MYLLAEKYKNQLPVLAGQYNKISYYSVSTDENIKPAIIVYRKFAGNTFSIVCRLHPSTRACLLCGHKRLFMVSVHILCSFIFVKRLLTLYFQNYKNLNSDNLVLASGPDTDGEPLITKQKSISQLPFPPPQLR